MARQEGQHEKGLYGDLGKVALAIGILAVLGVETHHFMGK